MKRYLIKEYNNRFSIFEEDVITFERVMEWIFQECMILSDLRERNHIIDIEFGDGGREHGYRACLSYIENHKEKRRSDKENWNLKSEQYIE